MTTKKALQEAIDAIDALIGKLGTGEMLSQGTTVTSSAAPAAANAPTVPATGDAQAKGQTSKAAKGEKKLKAEKKPKAAAPAPSTAASPEEELFCKAQLAVAKVVSAQPHPNSDKLYICKLDVGGGSQRQVVAGLQKYITVDELAGSHVVVVLNLKPAKLAGELSEAMILAASVKSEDVELVRVLRPAEGAVAGDAVFLEGGAAPAEYPKTLKQWSKIVEGLMVQGGTACYSGRHLVTAAGPVAGAADLPDGAEIH